MSEFMLSLLNLCIVPFQSMDNVIVFVMTVCSIIPCLIYLIRSLMRA